MIRLIVAGQEAVVRRARAIFPASERGGDQPTLDLLTQRMQIHEKTAWMLRAFWRDAEDDAAVGGNDLWGGADWRTAAPPNPDAVMNDVLGRIEKVIATIRELNPKARIFFVGIYNPFVATPAGRVLSAMVNRWNGRVLDTFGGDPNFTLVQTADLFTHRDRLALDRFHPGGEAYGLIARRIADTV